MNKHASAFRYVTSVVRPVRHKYNNVSKSTTILSTMRSTTVPNEGTVRRLPCRYVGSIYVTVRHQDASLVITRARVDRFRPFLATDCSQLITSEWVQIDSLKFLTNHSQYGAITKLIFQADACFYCKNDQFVQIVTDNAILGQFQNFKKQTKSQSFAKTPLKFQLKTLRFARVIQNQSCNH